MPAIGIKLPGARRLRQALAREELTLHFQPQVSLSTGRVEAVEALVRWRRPGHGMVLPDAFIHTARRGGLARRLDAWVLRNAAAEAAALSAAGFPLRVAANVAPCSLADPTLLDEVTSILDSADIAPSALEIEVTEQVLEGSEGQAATTLLELGRMGVSTALDDFGIGFSSLTRLATLPFTTLKIDRSLVSQMTRSERAATVFSCAVSLAHDLGFAVVAEGIETMRAWLQSASHGADRAQGWLIAPAMTRTELIAGLRGGAFVSPVGADPVRYGGASA
jgi:EAL domain-containing protein (putative c-di-GMP-specific phosphodiesterase class I)